MPEYVAPGVYVEEISTGPRIQAVSTSTVGRVMRHLPKLAMGIAIGILVGLVFKRAATSTRSPLTGTARQRDPSQLSWQDFKRRWVLFPSDLSPASVRIYLGTLSQVLDYAGCDPNTLRAAV
jgi:hypothetical protein